MEFAPMCFLKRWSVAGRSFAVSLGLVILLAGVHGLRSAAVDARQDEAPSHARAGNLHGKRYDSTPPPPPPIDPTPYGVPIVVGTPVSRPPLADRAIEPENLEFLAERPRFPAPVTDEEAVITFSPSGDRLLTQLGNAVMVRRLPSGIIGALLNGAVASSFGDLIVSPDGRFLAIANQHGQGSVEIWDLATGGRVREHRGGEQVRRLRFSPDGRILLAVRANYRQNLQLWDVATGTLSHNLDLEFSWRAGLHADVDPKRAVMAISNAENEIERRDLESGQVISRLATHRPEPWTVTAVSYSPDGDYLAAMLSSAGQSVDAVPHELFVWRGAEQVGTMAFEGMGGYWDDALVWAPDGSWLAFSHQASQASPGLGLVRWWPMGRKPATILTQDDRVVRGLAPSPDGRLLAIGWAKYAGDAAQKFPAETILWDVEKGKVARRLPGVFEPQWSPDQSLLVVRGDGVADWALHRFALDPAFVPTPQPTPSSKRGVFLPSLAR